MAPIDVAPRSLAPLPSSRVVWARPRTTGPFQRFQTGRPLSRRVEAAVTTAWGISILRYGRGRRHRHPHASADGKASEPSASEEGSASQAPNDRDVDRKFTAQFNAYTAAYFSPHRRLWRWARWRLKGLWPQKSKVQARPSGLQRTIAVVGYLLPLGVTLRLLVPPTLAGQSSLASLWLCLLTITSPISTPLGALTAASWLVCSLTDQEPCDFIRCHFRQALMLTSVSALLVFLERAPSPPDLGGEGRVPLVLSTTRNSLLGALLFWWLISVCCCLLGRCIGTVRNDLNGSRLVES